MIRRCLIPVLSVMVLLPVLAADGPPEAAPPAMTEEACVAQALAGNPAVRAAEAAAGAAAEAAGAARAPYYPQVDFSVGYRRWKSRAFLPSAIESLAPVPGGISPVIGPVDQYSYSLRGAYTLLDGGLRRADASAAGAAASAMAQDAGRTKADVVLSVRRAFFAVQWAKASLDVAGRDLARSEEHLRLAEARKAVGAVPLADVLRARVRVSDARVAQVRAGGDLTVALGALNAAMGLPSEAPLSVADAGAEPEAPRLPDPSESLRRAREGRPEMAEAARLRDAARFRVDSARSAYLPKVKAEAAYGRLDTSWSPEFHDWSVGLSLSIPVFTGFARGHNLARTKLELARAEDEEARASLAVGQEVFTARARVQTAWAGVEAVKDLVRDAEESLRMARERYAEGAGTVTDLLDAETSLVSAQAQEAKAVYDYRVASAEFARAQGEESDG